MRNKQHVLDACEGTIRRLTCDGRYFARPARSLFIEVRTHFSMRDQLRVWKVIETNIELALEHLARLPEGVGLDGVPRQCHAHTRKGTPCQREPLPGTGLLPLAQAPRGHLRGGRAAARDRRAGARRSLSQSHRMK